MAWGRLRQYRWPFLLGGMAASIALFAYGGWKGGAAGEKETNEFGPNSAHGRLCRPPNGWNSAAKPCAKRAVWSAAMIG